MDDWIWDVLLKIRIGISMHWNTYGDGAFIFKMLIGFCIDCILKYTFQHGVLCKNVNAIVNIAKIEAVWRKKNSRNILAVGIRNPIDSMNMYLDFCQRFYFHRFLLRLALNKNYNHKTLNYIILGNDCSCKTMTTLYICTKVKDKTITDSGTFSQNIDCSVAHICIHYNTVSNG